MVNMTRHDGCNWHKGVIDSPRLIDIPCLEGDLETTATHAESHRVHVDVWGIRARPGGI